MNGITWLASYPKSGNTWFRAFLTNLRRDADEPANINELEGKRLAASRYPFDEALGYDSAELTEEEIEWLRPEVYLHQARTATERLFHKVHDGYTYLPDGRPIFPPAATAGVLYFIRNPLDVCVSYSHHNGNAPLDSVIKWMADSGMRVAISEKGEALQLTQRYLSWSDNVTSWVDAPGLRIHVIRYEDMKLRPEEVFTAAARFAGLPDDPARIKKAIAFSRFEEMRAQEAKLGFGERYPTSASFFRKGEIGSWRERLSTEQVARLIADHGAVMRRFGYLNDRSEPVF